MAIRPIVRVSESVRQQTDSHFRTISRRQEEAIAYWAGVKSSDAWVVTTLLVPAALTTFGSFEVSPAGNAEVISFLSANGLRLIGQLHTHPGRSVGHSWGDEAGAAHAHENFLSIVIPHFGARGIEPLKKCGVHRFENGEFRRLARAEIATAIQWLPTEKIL